jgi:hypothetical protein
MESMIPPYSISTEDPHQCAFNKAYAKTRHHIENAFGLLVQKWRFMLKHLFYFDTQRMALTIMTCCALHNFCIDNNDDANQISEHDIQDFENDVRRQDSTHADETIDDVEVTIDRLDGLVSEIIVDLESTSVNTNLSIEQVQNAHDLSQQRGREVRQRMAAALMPLANTQQRRLRADRREQERQQRRQEREISRLNRNRSDRRNNRTNRRE